MITPLLNKVKLLKKNINQVIIGKEKQIDYVIASLLSNGHILLEDLPGMGKTVLAKTIAKSINASFARIQFTPDLLPNDITGIHFYNMKNQEFEWRPGPIHGNIILADEINRTTPRSQSAMLEAMAEGQVSVDGKTIVLPKPFFVLATQNPIETEGTFPLPEAQLDRFLIKLSLGYPTEEEEFLLIKRFQADNPLLTLTPVISTEEIIELQNFIQTIYISDELLAYTTKVIASLRNHHQIEVGPSPRATLALTRFAQSLAFMNERNYVIPDDIQESLFPVLEHRIILSMDASLQITAKDLLHDMLKLVPVPVEDVR